MRTKIVYILVSDANDNYYEQLLVSLYSLRLFNPTVDVTLVCDKDTNTNLVNLRSGFKQYVTSIVEVDVPDNINQAQRSRFIKTNLRQFIEGNYLFLDTDTIVCSSLEEIDNVNANISAVAEFNESFVITEWLKGDIEKSDLSLIGWKDILHKHYCNSGVMLVKDTETTHDFYRKWYDNWLKGASKGLLKDQPSLGLTNEQFGYIINELPGVWNCQVLQRNRDKYIEDAKIIHYFASIDELLNVFGIKNELLRIKYTGEISDDFKRKLQNPKKEIFEKRALIKGEQIEFVNSDMYEIYRCFPKLFKCLLFQGRTYIKLKQFAWDVIHKKRD